MDPREKLERLRREFEFERMRMELDEKAAMTGVAACVLFIVAMVLLILFELFA